MEWSPQIQRLQRSAQNLRPLPVHAARCGRVLFTLNGGTLTAPASSNAMHTLGMVSCTVRMHQPIITQCDPQAHDEAHQDHPPYHINAHLSVLVNSAGYLHLTKGVHAICTGMHTCIRVTKSSEVSN